MKKLKYIALSLLIASCGGRTDGTGNGESTDSIDENGEVVGQRSAEDAFGVASITNVGKVFNEVTNKRNCFIVISKKNLQLNVYEAVGGDTVLIAGYPACLSRVKGQKQMKGDMKTPESPDDQPFSISQIQDASTWMHDFGDGRGSFLAYGHWFMRLVTPGHSGIGIHGSTGNESSVPGRDSEGCIRLRDGDIIHLKENYAFEGMSVRILAEERDFLPFELRAFSKVDGYKEIPALNSSRSDRAAEAAPAAAEYESDNAGEVVGGTRAATGEEMTTASAAEVVPEASAAEAPAQVKGKVRVIVGKAKLFITETADNQYKSKEGNPYLANQGDVMPCVGAAGSFYRVRVNYEGERFVFVRKADCELVK